MASSFHGPNGSWESLSYVLVTDLMVLSVAVCLFLLKRWQVTRTSNSRHEEEGGRRCRLTSLSSLWTFVALPLSDVRRISRSDTVFQYLQFQQDLILILCLFALLGIGILVPIDYERSGHAGGIGSVTVEVVPAGSSALWVHIALTWIFDVILVVFFFVNLKRLKRSRNSLEARTVFAKSGVPSEWASDGMLTSALRRAIKKANVRCEVDGVFLVKDLGQLRQLEAKKRDTLNEIERSRVVRSPCPLTCDDVCCPRSRLTLDEMCAVVEDVRMRQRSLLLAEDAAQGGHVGGFPVTGKAFVTFRTAEGSLRFLAAVESGSMSADRVLRLDRWDLARAPPQSDVQWSSMYMPRVCRLGLLIVVNVAIVVMLLLFTTPTAVLSSAQSLHDSGIVVFRPVEKLLGFATSVMKGEVGGRHDVVTTTSSSSSSVVENMSFARTLMFSYLPSLMLLIINNVLLYTIYAAANYLEPYLTHSETQRAIMRKSYFFLLFNSVLLPALSLGSINALVERFRVNIECNANAATATDSTNLDPLIHAESHIKCGSSFLGNIFLQGSGSYFLVYVIHLACLTNTSQLLRIPERVYFMWSRRVAVTQTEREEALKNWPFEVGQQYALVLEAFTICVVFSTSVPIILLFGIFGLTCKHVVDKYNLLFVWRGEVKSASPVRVAAQELVLVAAGFHHVLMLGLVGLRGTTWQFRFMLLLFAFTTSAVAYTLNERAKARRARSRNRSKSIALVRSFTTESEDVAEDVRLVQSTADRTNFSDPLVDAVRRDVCDERDG